MTKNYNKLFKINHNPNWPYISDHPYRILNIGGSGSGKSIVLLNLIKHQWSDIEKTIYMSEIHSNQSINYLLMEDKK